MKPEPWRIRWDAKNTADYWEWAAQSSAVQEHYFALMRGHDLLRKVLRQTALVEPVLDLGAGRGDLAALLLAANYLTLTAETSEVTLAFLSDRFRNNPRFGGAVTSESRIGLPDQAVGTVFLVETLEHLPDDVVQPLFSEIRRVLRPGGLLVLTTPYGEDLARSEQMCPSCHCTYHRWQHVRSLTPASVSSLISDSGLSVMRCAPTYFSQHRGLHRWLESLRRRIEGHPDDRILCLARRHR